MLHPSKFFEWCAIRTGMDVFEIFDDNLKQKLINIHPKFQVYKVTIGYETERGNYKKADKYMILNNTSEQGYDDIWADMFTKDYELEHKTIIKNVEVLNVEFIGDAVLQIA